MPPAGRLGIIAGGGDLPRRLAEFAQNKGQGVYIAALKGFAEADLMKDFGGAEVSIGEPGRAIDLLRKAGCVDLVFAGTVRRPDLSAIKLDAKGVQMLPKLMGAALKGDDALLRVVLGAFEQAGFRVLGADEVLSDLLAPQGPMGRHAPREQDWADIRRAADVAAAIGALDIGQGAVACNTLILAVEAAEGTDAMLARCALLPASLRGAFNARRGVLVKRPKPMQERRIDLPTIGVRTVEGASAAGLAGIAVEAGAALLMGREEAIRAADDAGMFIYGFTASELAGR